MQALHDRPCVWQWRCLIQCFIEATGASEDGMMFCVFFILHNVRTFDSADRTRVFANYLAYLRSVYFSQL
jgi:hypothetical protein